MSRKSRKAKHTQPKQNDGYSVTRALSRFKIVPSGSRYWYGHLSVFVVILGLMALSAVFQVFDTWFVPLAVLALVGELVLGRLDKRNPPVPKQVTEPEMRVSRR